MWTFCSALASGSRWRIDRAARFQHPTGVLNLARRLAALAAILTLCVGNLAACAGWDATPEARMACCAGSDTCPMHHSASDEPGASSRVSQAQADTCCAISEGHESGTPTSTFATSASIALATSPLPALLPAYASTSERWRTLVPLPRRSPIPKHLLLSVFVI